MLHIAILADIALWDAAGKAMSQPLYRLLGGSRDRMPAYASDRLWYSLSLDELAESASQHVLDGYRTVKLRLGKEARPEGEVERVRTVRQAVGADVRILVDATESWDRAPRFKRASVAGGWHHLAGGSPPSSGSQRTFSPGGDARDSHRRWGTSVRCARLQNCCSTAP